MRGRQVDVDVDVAQADHRGRVQAEGSVEPLGDRTPQRALEIRHGRGGVAGGHDESELRGAHEAVHSAFFRGARAVRAIRRDVAASG